MLIFAAGTRAAQHRSSHRRHSVPSRLQAEKSAKERTLHKLQQEIAKYESELNEHEKRERKSQQNIRAFDKRTATLKAIIAGLEVQASALQGTKREVDKSLHVTANTLDTLKDAYARSSRQLYIEGALTPVNANELLLVPQPEDPVRMAYYTELIARAHAMNRSRLDSMKQALAASSSELAGTIASAQEQIGEHQNEAGTIQEQKAEESVQLAQIQANKARLLKLIAARKASEQRLEGLIANLVIREAKARSAARASARRTGRTAERREREREASLGPASGSHSLEWPGASHRILEGFGEHRNADLNTVTMNLGIDIAARQGSAVKAAAQGIVALVSSLPSFGTIIVLQHAGGLHTVYANLRGVRVKAGEHLSAGTEIGTSGENDSGTPLIHFEVWNGKNQQNPLGWLRK